MRRDRWFVYGQVLKSRTPFQTTNQEEIFVYIGHDRTRSLSTFTLPPSRGAMSCSACHSRCHSLVSKHGRIYYCSCCLRTANSYPRITFANPIARNPRNRLSTLIRLMAEGHYVTDKCKSKNVGVVPSSFFSGQTLPSGFVLHCLVIFYTRYGGSNLKKRKHQIQNRSQWLAEVLTRVYFKSMDFSLELWQEAIHVYLLIHNEVGLPVSARNLNQCRQFLEAHVQERATNFPSLHLPLDLVRLIWQYTDCISEVIAFL